MATITRAVGALPTSGGTISAAPLTDTFNNIMNFIESTNIDENNVNLTATNGIAGKSTSQTLTGLKTFANTAAAAGGVRNAIAIAHQPATGTPTANDGVSVTFLGYDGGSNSKTYGEVDIVFTTVTAGSEVGRLDLKLIDAGTAGRTAATLTAKGVLTLGLAGTNTGKLALTGATSGTITINGAAVAGTWTLQLPANGGTANYALTTDGAGVASWSQLSLTAGVTGILPTANGGTGIAYFTAAGPTVARVYTFPDAATTVLTTNAAVTVAQGGTGVATFTSNGVLYGNGTGAVQATAQGGANTILIANASAPSWSASPNIGTSLGIGVAPNIGFDMNKARARFSSTAYAATDFTYTSTDSVLVISQDLTMGSTSGNLVIFSSDVSAADKGGVLALGGKYGGVNVYIPYAALKGAQGTAANKGYLAFGSLVAGNMTEGMRLDENARLGINNTAAFGTEYLGVLAPDNGTALGLKINATQANITTTDIFAEFRSTSGVEGSIAGTATAGVIAYNTFTGAHYAQLEDETEIIEMGMLVAASGNFLEGETEYIPRIRKTKERNDKAVYGVMSGKIAEATPKERLAEYNSYLEAQIDFEKALTFYNLLDEKEREFAVKPLAPNDCFSGFACDFSKGNSEKSLYQIFALGTGIILVTDSGGDIEVGDLLASSPVPGYGEKQADDLVHSYTIATATEAVLWSNEPQKVKLIACTYSK